MKTTTETHTPTPWIAGEDRTFKPQFNVGRSTVENGEQAGVGSAITIARCYKEEDAAFIVRAVNAHDALLEVAKDALAVIKRLADEKGMFFDDIEKQIGLEGKLEQAIAKARP